MGNGKSMDPYGELEIFKVYRDGTEELAFSEYNVITSGMGVGFSHLFAASGGTTITDYQILNFQVGTDGDINDYGASTFALNTPLDTADYGGDTELIIESFQPIENGALGTSKDFARIRFSNIHRVTDTSVRFTLVLDRDSANTFALNEVGLFMRNPRGLSTASPILVAYRPHTEITKTSEFSLIYRWTLTFA